MKWKPSDEGFSYTQRLVLGPGSTPKPEQQQTQSKQERQTDFFVGSGTLDSALEHTRRSRRVFPMHGLFLEGCTCFMEVAVPRRASTLETVGTFVRVSSCLRFTFARATT